MISIFLPGMFEVGMADNCKNFLVCLALISGVKTSLDVDFFRVLEDVRLQFLEGWPARGEILSFIRVVSRMV